jgi:DNA-binding NarL/FixJ family response regulator
VWVADPPAQADRAPVRLLIAGQNPLFRIGSVAAFAGLEQIDVVGEVATGAQALELARLVRPDVVLLEVGLADELWLPVLSELATLSAVMLMTHREEPQDVTRVIESGASGYLVHGRYDLNAFVHAVLDVARGLPSASPEVMTMLVDALRRRTLRAHPVPEAAASLTDRERDIIALVVNGLSNDQVARRLGLTVKTVKNNLQSIYGKLSVRSKPAAITVWLGSVETSQMTTNLGNPPGAFGSTG